MMIISVIMARVMPTRTWFDTMSVTKLISGTPGTMNSVQAIKGW